MVKKYYAVKTGKMPGVYETWAECQKQVSGFYGAVYKSFKTREEAVAFLNNSKSMESSQAETQVTAYVDGSYDSVTNAFSYGMVLFHDGKEFHFSKRFIDSDLAEMRNVAGEIKGAEAAMLYCLKNHFTSVTIFHDYEGIAKWCTGEWKAKKTGTIAYRNCYLKACSKLEIQFIKVKGHSGNRYNELADKLAKAALGI